MSHNFSLDPPRPYAGATTESHTHTNTHYNRTRVTCRGVEEQKPCSFHGPCIVARGNVGMVHWLTRKMGKRNFIFKRSFFYHRLWKT